MSRFDHDNPEWTEADFARAVGPDQLPDAVLAAFPRTRGRPKAEVTKVPVSLRLSPHHLERFKSTGKGWQSRIDEALSANYISPGMADLLRAQDGFLASIDGMLAALASGSVRLMNGNVDITEQAIQDALERRERLLAVREEKLGRVTPDLD